MKNTGFPSLSKPAIYRKSAKKYEKSLQNLWWICYKAVILHPQSREIRGKLEIVKTKMRFEPAGFEKRDFSKKT